jgi:hypothetical protein
MSSLPFVDVLYIRCDWRNVQTRPGRLDLNPVFHLAMDAARRKGLRVAFRIQLSNYSFQPDEVALPEFLRDRVPMVKIGRIPEGGNSETALRSSRISKGVRRTERSSRSAVRRRSL